MNLLWQTYSDEWLAQARAYTVANSLPDYEPCPLEVQERLQAVVRREVARRGPRPFAVDGWDAGAA